MSWIDEQLVARGIHEARALDAMRRVPRDAFGWRDLVRFADDDRALVVGEGKRSRSSRSEVARDERAGRVPRPAATTSKSSSATAAAVTRPPHRMTALPSRRHIAYSHISLLDQRPEGGRLVSGRTDHQRLTVITLRGDRVENGPPAARRTDGVRKETIVVNAETARR